MTEIIEIGYGGDRYNVFPSVGAQSGAKYKDRSAKKSGMVDPPKFCATCKLGLLSSRPFATREKFVYSLYQPNGNAEIEYYMNHIRKLFRLRQVSPSP